MSTDLNLNISTDEQLIKNMNPATYAFVGDAVYTLFVRIELAKTPRPSKELHASSVEYVKASAQAKAYEIIKGLLSETEEAIYKRGRNFHTNNTPKNASNAEYHSATGLETLFGYLYLTNNTSRAAELFSIIWNNM